MNKFHALAVLCFCGLAATTLLIGQETVPSSIAVLPLHSNGLDSATIETAESILRTEIGKLSPMDIVSHRRTAEALGGTACVETDCALELGTKLKAAQVLGCRLSVLGEKVIVQYFLADVAAGREVVVDQVTASNIEELEGVMKRIAKSVVDRLPIGKGADVGNVLPSETREPLRRVSRKNFGIAFGYLYPQAGYDNSDQVFVADARFDFELPEYAVGMLLGIRKGFAMNLYGSYLLTKTDLCPYVGGAFGFHWVSHDATLDPIRHTLIKARSDGFEVTANAGMRVLHTYNFQLLFNLEYIRTLNDYNDGAIVFTIGIL